LSAATHGEPIKRYNVEVSNEERRARAEKRRSIATVRLVSLEEAATDPFPVSGLEGILLAWELSKQAWSLSGKPFPSYDRANLPIRLVKRSD